jgi:4-amino-4-deoxy-L-arabinose transferase-like glycosyltransferase
MRLTRDGPQRWILLIAILWLAFALRFFALGAQELRGDEAASWARITQEPGPIELFQRLVAEGQPHPPLHYWSLQAWARVLGYSEYALRSLSALLSVLVVALVYRVPSGCGWA